MAGYVKHENAKQTFPKRYNGDGQLVQTMYANATGGLTSGTIVEFTLHPTYGWAAEYCTSGYLKKGYVPKSINSGEYGDIVLEGYCPNCITTHDNSATAWATCTGYSIQLDSGLNASNGAAAPATGVQYFAVLVSSSPDSSSTSHVVAGDTAVDGYLVNIFLINDALEHTS
jgi:hypothetical protein